MERKEEVIRKGFKNDIGSQFVDPHALMKDAISELSQKGFIPEDELKKIVELLDAIKKGDFYRELNVEMCGVLGELARKIEEFKKDLQILNPKIKDIVEKDIPSASNQLELILEAIEKAALSMMDVVERLIEINNEIEREIENVSNFLPKEKKSKLRSYITASKDFLNELITSLSFQDLTGQKLKKIISLIQDIEKRITDLIVRFGMKIKKDGVYKLESGEASTKKVDQSEVDNLLKEFGF